MVGCRGHIVMVYIVMALRPLAVRWLITHGLYSYGSAAHGWSTVVTYSWFIYSYGPVALWLVSGGYIVMARIVTAPRPLTALRWQYSYGSVSVGCSTAHALARCLMASLQPSMGS